MNVYVMGIGMISSMGLNVEETLRSLSCSQPGVEAFLHLPTQHKANYVGGEVNLSDDQLMERVGIMNLTRTTMLGLLAAREAVIHAEIAKGDEIITGLISASTAGGMKRSEKYYQDFIEGRKTPPFINTHDGADSTELIGTQLGISDFITTINTACASSLNAIILGARMIKNNMLDRVVVGGTDALCRFTFNGFRSLLLLDNQACKPFDAHRKGINLGEGAAYLVLESEDVVRLRNKRPLAQISGYGLTNDAYHQTASSPEGSGLQQAMKDALNTAHLDSDAIDYINAHGTGTLNNDLTEGLAMKAVFKDQVPAFSSTKPFTGHTLGAAGAIEAVLSILTIQQQIILPNLNFSTPITEHGLLPITELARAQIKHVMSNSAGMGGSCSSIIFSQS